MEATENEKGPLLATCNTVGLKPGDVHYEDGVRCLQTFWKQAPLMPQKEQMEMLGYIKRGDYIIIPSALKKPSSHMLYRATMRAKKEKGDGALSWPIYLILATVYHEKQPLPEAYVELVAKVHGTSAIDDFTGVYWTTFGVKDWQSWVPQEANEVADREKGVDETTAATKAIKATKATKAPKTSKTSTPSKTATETTKATGTKKATGSAGIMAKKVSKAPETSEATTANKAIMASRLAEFISQLTPVATPTKKTPQSELRAQSEKLASAKALRELARTAPAIAAGNQETVELSSDKETSDGDEISDGDGEDGDGEDAKGEDAKGEDAKGETVPSKGKRVAKSMPPGSQIISKRPRPSSDEDFDVNDLFSDEKEQPTAKDERKATLPKNRETSKQVSLKHVQNKVVAMDLAAKLERVENKKFRDEMIKSRDDDRETADLRWEKFIKFRDEDRAEAKKHRDEMRTFMKKMTQKLGKTTEET